MTDNITKQINQLRWLWLSIGVILLDQYVKWWVSTNLDLYDKIKITPFLNIILSHNRGAAFGMFHNSLGWQRWLFMIIAVVVSITILLWLSKFPRRENWMASALALILAGAIGNFYDRVAHFYVIDMIDFHIHSWHFATFNIADSAITIGIIMWLYGTLFFEGKNW